MKIYQKTWFIILMLFALPPVGIILMWTGKKFNKIIRIILTVFFSFVTLFDILLFTIDTNETANNSEISTTEISSVAETTIKSNTTQMVDKLSEDAKNDAKTATDADIEKALNYLNSNVDKCFEDNKIMENFIYYGALLNYKFEDSDKRSKIGFQALKTVKYVYRGVESKTDEVTIDNVKQLKEMLNDYFAKSTDNESTSKQETSSKSATNATKEATAASTTTKKQTTTQNAPKGDGRTVYTAPTGKRYHFDPDCGGKNSSATSLDDALSRGLTPCQKCAS